LDVAVGTLDALAEKHGLERVKLVGDTYFAVCGVNHPYLDHAPRGVAFAVEARDAFADLQADGGSHLELASGIHSGPVTAGLSGSTRLVYDLWGQTVSTAHYLARAARPGEIIISEETQVRLPPNVIIEARENLATVDVWTVAGIRAEEVVDV
jgi:class 3 adenylate cyclase